MKISLFTKSSTLNIKICTVLLWCMCMTTAVESAMPVEELAALCTSLYGEIFGEYCYCVLCIECI